MANPQHLAIFKQGVQAWNAWREGNPTVHPDLSDAKLDDIDMRFAHLDGVNFRLSKLNGIDFAFASLREADFREAELGLASVDGDGVSPPLNLSLTDLQGADFRQASFWLVDFASADLRGVQFSEARFIGIKLNGADLRGCNLQGVALKQAELINADLSSADLSGVSLEYADLFQTNVSDAILLGTNLWGAKLSSTNLQDARLIECHLSATYDENLRLDGAIQQDFVIGPGYPKPSRILVDQFEVAQFFSYVLEHPTLSRMIQRIQLPVVLLVGNFSGERKAIAQAIKEELRQRRIIPMTFSVEDVVPPRLGELLAQLLRWVRFVFVDGTEAPLLLHELQQLLPDLPAVPMQLFWQGSAPEHVAEEIKPFPHILSPVVYTSANDVCAIMQAGILDRLEQMAQESVG